MGRLSDLPVSTVLKILATLGFEIARQKGSHIILKKTTENGAVGCVVPNHKTIKLGTLRSILRQAGISVAEFEQHL